MSSEPNKAGREVDTIWYTRCPVPTAFSLAINLGWLDDEFRADGIAVSSLGQSTDRKTKESHFNHTLEDSFRYGGNIPPIWAKATGSDTKLIGIARIDAPHVVLSLPESGIREPADLKGKRLSIPRRVNDQIDFWRAGAIRTYEVVLATAGLTLDDVTLVDVPIQQTFIDPTAPSTLTGSIFSGARRRGALSGDLFALVRGEVDAIFSESFFSVQLRKFLGAHVVYDVHNHLDPRVRHNNAIPQVFTVSAGLAQDRPDLVARVVARTLEAGNWARANREEVIRVTALEGGISEDVADYTYPKLEEHLGTNLSPDNVDLVRLRKQFLLTHGFIDRDFSLDDWIDPRPLALAQELLRERGRLAA